MEIYFLGHRATSIHIMWLCETFLHSPTPIYNIQHFAASNVNVPQFPIALSRWSICSIWLSLLSWSVIHTIETNNIITPEHNKNHNCKNSSNLNSPQIFFIYFVLKHNSRGGCGVLTNVDYSNCTPSVTIYKQLSLRSLLFTYFGDPQEADFSWALIFIRNYKEYLKT